MNKYLQRSIQFLLILCLLPCFNACTGVSRVRNYMDDIAGRNKTSAKPSYLAVESNSGYVMYSFNSNERRQIGMLANIGTAAVIADWIAAKNVDPCTLITVPNEIAPVQNSVANPLRLAPGERISVRDALYSILMSDDSASAITLAQHCGSQLNYQAPQAAFIAQMNRLAYQLGMKNTYFAASCANANTRSTARDLALLSMYTQQKVSIQLMASQQSALCSIHDLSGQIRTNTINNNNQLVIHNHDVDGLKATNAYQTGASIVASARRPSVKRADPTTGNELTYPQNMIVVIIGMKDKVRYQAASSFLKDGWAEWEQWRQRTTPTNENEFIQLLKSL